MARAAFQLIHPPVNSMHLPQVLATLAVSLGPFAAGIGKGYSSPALASLQEPKYGSSDNLLTITSQEASWVAGLSLLGALFGDIIAGAAVALGRRKLLLLTALPFSAAWLLTVFADHVGMICATSFVGGFCSAIIILATNIYISEIASPQIRGALSAITKIASCGGLLVCFTLGAYLHWRKLALVASAIPLLSFILVCNIPESPCWMVYQGDDDLALIALQWLRGPHSTVEVELETIKIICMQRRLRCASSKTSCSIEWWKEKWRKRAFAVMVRPVLLTCAITFFRQFSGAQVLNYYAVTIFKDTFISLNPHNVAILHAFVQLIASCLFGLLVDRVGRVPLLALGSVVMAGSLLGLGCYVHPHLGGRPMERGEWIPLFCVTAFTLAFYVGIGPIAGLLISELFPLEYRGGGSAFATCFSHMCGFIAVKTFVDFEKAFHLSGTLWAYSTVSVVGLVFILTFVPETKGKQLEEIQESFENT